MEKAPTDELERLHRAARRLRARAGLSAQDARRLPALLLLTDPDRTPDPAAAAGRLPKGSGVVFRSFGARDALATGARLRSACRTGGVLLMVGADERLAALLAADGVHLPERLAGLAGRIRRRRPSWLVTAAAHGPAAVRRAKLAGAQAVLVSVVFASASASAGRPLGAARFAALVRGAGLPVYALGGVNARTAVRLAGSGAAGLAAVEGLART